MKPHSEKTAPLILPVDLNEEVLEAAASVPGEPLAPETTESTASITVWDESVETTGRHAPQTGLEGDVSIAEKLVLAGNEEADRERRAAAVRV